MNMSALVDDRTWRQRRWVSFGVALALIVVLIPVSQASAEGESIGCILTNMMTTQPGSSISTRNDFNEGEVVTVDVSLPTDGASAATLTVNGDQIDSTTIPGTLSYEIPKTDTYTITAAVEGSATFDFNCTVGTGGPTDPPAPPSGEYCDSGKAFGKSVSAKAKAGDTKGKDGYNAGAEKGFSSCKDSG